MPFDADRIARGGEAEGGQRPGALRRVMMIAPHFEEYAYLLARGLAGTCEVALVLDAGRLESDFAGRTRPEAPRVTVSPNRFRSPADLLRLVAGIVRFRPQVIHWQEPSGLVKAVMAAVIVTLCRPFLTLALTIHDPVPHSGRDSTTARRLAPFRRYARRRVHRIFVHGPSCRDQYLHHYLPHPHRDGRVALTEHGVILAGEGDAPPEPAFHALMFGRMERYKGLGILCEAMERLAADGHDVPLHLAGSGPELDALEARFRRHPAVRVDNRFVAAADLIAMIRASDGILLPYTGATQSGVLAAAFGNGRFVIASRVGGIADIVEDGVNGLLVPPGDAEALAAALRTVAADPALRARLRDGARRTAAERLSWPGIAARMIADYPIAAGARP
jgi:glycosyltransferase involved in cell wall biosynthesis